MIVGKASIIVINLLTGRTATQAKTDTPYSAQNVKTNWRKNNGIQGSETNRSMD
jgi:hypothetical protein